MFKLRPKLHKPTATNETGRSVSVVTKIRTGKSLLNLSRGQGFLSWLQLALRSFQILCVCKGTGNYLPFGKAVINHQSQRNMLKVKKAGAVTKLQVQGRNGL